MKNPPIMSVSQCTPDKSRPMSIKAVKNEMKRVMANLSDLFLTFEVR